LVISVLQMISSLVISFEVITNLKLFLRTIMEALSSYILYIISYISYALKLDFLFHYFLVICQVVSRNCFRYCLCFVSWISCNFEIYLLS